MAGLDAIGCSLASGLDPIGWSLASSLHLARVCSYQYWLEPRIWCDVGTKAQREIPSDLNNRCSGSILILAIVILSLWGTAWFYGLSNLEIAVGG